MSRLHSSDCLPLNHSWENVIPIVPDETLDRTTEDSVRPSSDNARPSNENTHTTVRSDRIVARGVIGGVWAIVVDIGYL
jgi:hypothetical protein